MNQEVIFSNLPKQERSTAKTRYDKLVKSIAEAKERLAHAKETVRMLEFGLRLKEAELQLCNIGKAFNEKD